MKFLGFFCCQNGVIMCNLSGALIMTCYYITFRLTLNKKDGYHQRNACQFLQSAILASPGYAPGTIAVTVTWMKRGFNACQTHCSMYQSIFNRFPVIQPVSLKVCHFSTFWPLLGTLLGQSR